MILFLQAIMMMKELCPSSMGSLTTSKSVKYGIFGIFELLI